MSHAVVLAQHWRHPIHLTTASPVSVSASAARSNAPSSASGRARKRVAIADIWQPLLHAGEQAGDLIFVTILSANVQSRGEMLKIKIYL
jgi:hypothetical protein